jgi:hypothetical protein
MTITPLLILLSTTAWAQNAFGTWGMNPARSVFIGDPHARAVTIRFEPHTKGEVFTWDAVRDNGQAETFSIILYFDGKVRDFQGLSCPGMGFQSSRRLDNRAIEISLNCQNGPKARIVRQMAPNVFDLILDITAEFPDGRRLGRHLVFEKQNSTKR